MRTLMLIVTGIVFCAVAALFADKHLLIETIAQSSVPYVAVPISVGLLMPRSSVVRATLVGALSSVALVVAFYGTTALDSEYPLSMWGPRFWAVSGAVSGALLALSAWSLKPRMARNPWVWSAGGCAALALIQVYIIQRGRPATTAEVIVLFAVLTFWCGVIIGSLRAQRTALAK